MPESRIAIGHRRPIKFAVKSAYGFATDTSKLSPPVDPGPRRGQGYASGILDTWNRANLQLGVQLMPSADFQNYYSTASAPSVCFRFLTLASPPVLTYFPPPPYFSAYRASFLSSNLRFSITGIDVPVQYRRACLPEGNKVIDDR